MSPDPHLSDGLPFQICKYHENWSLIGARQWLGTRCNFRKASARRAGFDAVYRTEEKCRALVIASRWANGFECPACSGRAYCKVKTRGPFQCYACLRQTSPIAGTVYALTQLPLRGRAEYQPRSAATGEPPALSYRLEMSPGSSSRKSHQLRPSIRRILKAVMPKYPIMPTSTKRSPN